MKSLLRKIGSAGFAFAVIAAWALRGQPPNRNVYAEASALASEMGRAPSVRGWFAVNRQRVKPEHAAAAEELARQALTAQDPVRAHPFSAFASYAYLYLGDNARSLRNRLDERDEAFDTATTPEQYNELRRTVIENREQANSVNRPDLIFAFSVLAADCSFFASTAKLGLNADEPLFNAVGDEADALIVARFAPSREWLERLISLIGATSHKVIRMGLLGEQKVRMDPLLKQLASGTERSTPPDFKFTIPRWGDLNKSIAIGDALAELSYKYGNAAVAGERLNVAATRARQSHNEALWLAILSHRYAEESGRGKPPEQLRPLREEIRSASQDMRAKYRSRAGRIWAGFESDSLYGPLLRDQLADSSAPPEESFSFVEALKARTLLDELHFPPASESAPRNVATLERRVLGFEKETSATESVAVSEARLIDHLSFSDEQTRGAFEMEGKSPRVEALTQLEAEYEKARSGFEAVATPVRLAEVQQALGPREAILEYVLPYHRSHPAFDLSILLITRTGFRNVHVALNEILPFNIPMIGRIVVGGKAPREYSPFGELVIQMRTAIQTGDEQASKLALQRLHRILIQPLTDQGVRLENFDRLVIVPHGVAHYVPFAALMDTKGTYLIAKTALTVAPSASVWLALSKRNGSVRRLVEFGNPDLRGRSVGELKYAAQEIADIPKLVPAAQPVVFAGPNATEDRFIQEAPSANILHVSTHGEFPDENAIDLHAILLAKGIFGDGAMRAARVRTLKLSANRLVVLSVCNGGLYRIGPGDEPYGLIPAFLEAGSQNVLGTLWRLDDQFGKNFMEEFYRHVMRDGPAEAYRKACLRFLKADEDLRNWAGFVLVGPGRPFAN